MGRPNLMRNVVKKTSKVLSEKKGWLGKLTTKHLHMTSHTTSNTFDVNQKENKKGC